MWRIKVHLSIGSFVNIHSLRFKIFIVLFIVSVAVMFMSIQLLYMQSVKTIEENACDYVYESMEYADNNLDIMINEAKMISVVIASNVNTVKSNMLNNVYPEASYEWFMQKKEVEEFLSSLVSYKNHIKMAAVVGIDNRCFQSGGPYLLKEIRISDWFKKVKDENVVQILYNTPENNRIFICRPIVYDKKTYAIAIIELDFNIVSSVYKVTPLEQASIYTLSSDDELIFTNNFDEYDAPSVDIPLADLRKEYSPQQRYYWIGGEKQLVVVYSSSVNKLTTIGLISYNNLITDALNIRKWMIAIFSVLVVLVIIFSWGLSKLLSRNILRLQGTMKQVESGNLKVRAVDHSNDEIGKMAGVFNSMMDRIEKLIEDVKNIEHKKRIAEQNALQAQVQPHFICNAINSIKYVAHMKNETEIEDVSTALIDLIRGTLENKSEFIPLWQEYTYIEDYVRIQRFKYRQKFVLGWDVEEGLWSYMIPKLLLQPIIENSVVHGINKRENGVISVKIRRANDCVNINISDNGEGMTGEEIEAILDKEKTRSNGIGLTNVFERISLIYGSEYVGKVTSFKGAFTSVELNLPLNNGGTYEA